MIADPDEGRNPPETGREMAGDDRGTWRDILDAERANTAQWRLVAGQRAAALDDLRSRPVVRIALGIDRRVEPLRRTLGRNARRLYAGAGRAAIVPAAIRARRALPGRRTALREVAAGVPPAPVDARSVSVVVVDGLAPRPLPSTSGVVTELVSVLTDEHAEPTPGARHVLRLPAREAAGATLARAIASSTGELVCVLAPSAVPLDDGWLAHLVGAVRGGVVLAAPTLVHPERPLATATRDDLLVREEGREVVAREGRPVLRARRAGSGVDVTRPVVDVHAVSGACFVVAREAFEAAGGLAPLTDVDAAVADLCARLRAGGGRVVTVPQAVVVDHRPVSSPRRLVEPLDERGSAWRAVVARDGPALLRAAQPLPSGRLRFALTVAAPSRKVVARWGDWHLATALGEALRRQGHEVRLAIAAEADDPAVRSCDVHVVLRGLAPVARTPGQRHVVWVISHPEGITDDECDDADLVLVASARFAGALRRRTATPVEVFLQATDPNRFRPVPPQPAHVHPVTVVAKSREVLRPIVADALAAGLRPAIYGGGWAGLVDPDLVVADHISNEELPVVYASAGVVLNDHWETMRAWGFVSNRIFDVLACGAPIVSDHLPEIPALFGDAVPTYRDPAELRDLVDAALADPEAARRRVDAARGDIVARHTFDHRARSLAHLLDRYRLVEAGRLRRL